VIALIERPVLSPADSALLSKRRQSSTTAWRDWQRAVIILEYSNGASVSEAGRAANCTRDTVRKWVRRYNAAGDEGLDDLARSGAPPIHGPVAVLALIALATSRAPYPDVSWSHRLLAEHLATRGIEVSRSWVGRCLADHDLDVTHVQGWLRRTGDPQVFAERAKDLCDLLIRGPGDGGVVVCIDEKTSISAVRRPVLDTPPGVGRVRRVEFGYSKRGNTNLITAYRHDTGEVLWAHIERNNTANYLWFLAQVSRWAGYKKPIHLVRDNGASHTSFTTRAWLEKHPRFVEHPTPVHASWLNPVEMVFSTLSRAVIRGRSSDSIEDLRAAIDSYFENRAPVPVKWRYEWPE